MTLSHHLPAACRWARPVALAAAFAASSAHAFDSGSTGADGALAPTVNTEIQLPPSGILNYTSINIPQGVTVKFKRNALNTPVHLLVSGNVTIAGSLDIRGEDAKDVGTYGDGKLGDDGLPGAGGPGGHDGGRGGRDDLSMRPEIIRGGAGLGPGGGVGGLEGGNSCAGDRGYYRYLGLGAAYLTHGSSGFRYYGCSYDPNSPLAYQAKAYGSALLQPLVGGSGGGGGRGGPNYPGSGGGGGGGALLIAASGTLSIPSTGSIDATGGDAGGVSGDNAGGTGGGGSGGAIRLVASTITGSGNVFANGGCRHDSNNRRQDCLNPGYYYAGSGGSQGRIRFEAEAITFNGRTEPTYVGDQPGPIFLASVPALRIDSVAGVAVPAVPTGTADVALAADTPNPVTVTFKTTNVPTGNTVLLRVVPAYGDPIEALSPAITGSAAEGQASVQVTLPSGPSVLQATTTYTVVVAMGEALAPYAGNERVEKVELVATLGAQGEEQARLITVTGKSFTVPAAVLRLAGAAG